MGAESLDPKELREEMWRLLEDNLTALQRAVNDPAFSSMTEPYYKAKGAIDFMQTVLDPAIRRWTAALDSGLTASEREQSPEREAFVEAAFIVFKKEAAYQDGEPRENAAWFFRVAIANAVETYRAMLAAEEKRK